MDNFIYANDYTTNLVHKFDKVKGTLVRTYDMTHLSDLNKIQVGKINRGFGYDSENNVLNGIAYSKERKTFLMTGKRWS